MRTTRDAGSDAVSWRDGSQRQRIGRASGSPRAATRISAITQMG